jgi:uncharacterized repeat protein (TIGR02543 family)
MHAQWWVPGYPWPTGFPSESYSYSITYILNRGRNSPANPTEYTIESPAIILAEPTRSGYAFSGWYDSEALTGSPVPGIPEGSTGDKTFWAKWIDTGNGGITFTIGDFTLTDPAEAALSGTPILSKSGAGGKPQSLSASVSGSDNDTQAVWYVGAAEIGTGSTVTLDADALSLGTPTLRVTAEFSGVRHSKEITFTVEN